MADPRGLRRPSWDPILALPHARRTVTRGEGAGGYSPWIRTPDVSSTLTRQLTVNGTSSSRSFTLPS